MTDPRAHLRTAMTHAADWLEAGLTAKGALQFLGHQERGQ